MRDPDRIDTVLNKLRTFWKANPDLRLGQIISNATQTAWSDVLDLSRSEDDWSDTLRRAIFNVEDDALLRSIPVPCAACGRNAEGEHSIHRDGFDDGPEVPICNACGSGEAPTCDELWERISERGLYGDR